MCVGRGFGARGGIHIKITLTFESTKIVCSLPDQLVHIGLPSKSVSIIKDNFVLHLCRYHQGYIVTSCFNNYVYKYQMRIEGVQNPDAFIT